MYPTARTKVLHERLADRPLYLLLLTYFTLVFTLTVVILYLYDVRPLFYYAVMATLGLVILLQILYVEPVGIRPMAILAQIMAFSLNLIWGVTLNYDLFIGRTDTLPHIWWARDLLQVGHVTDFLNVYEPFPLWYILCNSVYLLGGLTGSVARVMFVNSGLIYGILGTFCIYLLARKISGDRRIALLAALFLSFNTTFVFYGMYSIPRSIVMILFILLVVLLIDHEDRKKRWLAYGLTLPIVVYHTVSSLFLICILLLIYVIQKLFIRTKKDPIVTLRFLAVLVGVTACYWALNATNIIWTLTNSLTQSSAGAEGLQTGSIYETPLSEVFNYSQYSVWILFILAGVLLILRYKHVDIKLKILALAALVLIPLSYPGPLMLMNTLSSTVSIGRFEEYAFMFMTVIAAAGFGMLYKKMNRIAHGLLVLAFVLMVFLSISNDFVSSDNPIVERPFYTYYLNTSEITGMMHIASLTEGSVMSDYIAVRYLEKSPYLEHQHILEANVITGKLMKENSTDLILIRDGELEKRPVKLYSSDNGYVRAAPWNALEYYYAEDAVFASLGERDRVYSTGSMTAYA
jgi:hypothetical protein